MGENHIDSTPVALYGLVLLMCGCSYVLLQRALIAHHGRDSALAAAVGRDRKGLASLALYVTAVSLAFVAPWIAIALYVVVAILWFIPDRRFDPSLLPR
jgi:uncharacterized membrane protein